VNAARLPTRASDAPQASAVGRKPPSNRRSNFQLFVSPKTYMPILHAVFLFSLFSLPLHFSWSS
jgi:hypothetical protein